MKYMLKFKFNILKTGLISRAEKKEFNHKNIRVNLFFSSKVHQENFQDIKFNDICMASEKERNCIWIQTFYLFCLD